MYTGYKVFGTKNDRPDYEVGSFWNSLFLKLSSYNFFYDLWDLIVLKVKCVLLR